MGGTSCRGSLGAGGREETARERETCCGGDGDVDVRETKVNKDADTCVRVVAMLDKKGKLQIINKRRQRNEEEKTKAESERRPKRRREFH